MKKSYLSLSPYSMHASKQSGSHPLEKDGTVSAQKRVIELGLSNLLLLCSHIAQETHISDKTHTHTHCTIFLIHYTWYEKSNAL